MIIDLLCQRYVRLVLNVEESQAKEAGKALAKKVKLLDISKREHSLMIMRNRLQLMKEANK